jgi:hypothetical protein
VGAGTRVTGITPYRLVRIYFVFTVSIARGIFITSRYEGLNYKLFNPTL